MALPPGPRGVPIVGSLLEMGRDPLAFLSGISARYGDVALARLGRASAYILADPQHIEQVLIGRYRDCIKDFGTQELRPIVGGGLLTSEGEFWRRQRRLASPPLQPKRIAAYADTMVACAERTSAEFRDNEVRDIYAEMMTLTLEIVGKTLLGVDARRDAEAIARIMQVAMRYFDKQLRSWHGLLPQRVLTPDRHAFRKAVKELDEIVYRMIARRRAQQFESDDLLSRLLNARDDNGEAMSDAQLRDEAVTMLLAGHETTAIALSFAVYLLSEHPAVATRLREELREEIGSRPARFEDLGRLRFLDAVVKETLRLYPPAYLMGREVIEPFEIAGYRIPNGAQVLMSPYVIQRDPRRFPEPDRFMPERWLEERPLPRFAYFPFGGGPRVCIGIHFAQMEVALVLATMVQQLDLTLVPGFEVDLYPVVTLRPRNGVRVLVRRRSPPPDARRSPWSLRVGANAS